MSLTSSSARRAGRSFAPSVSGLEDRQLLAGSLGFSGGTLSFYAGVGASSAELSPSTTTPGNVVATIDGQSQEFAAANVKLVVFYSSLEGQDSFVNNTNKTSISDLAGTGNSVVGGTGADYVIDYGGDAAIDDLDGGIVYVDANDGRSHSYGVSFTRSGSVLVRVS